MCAVYFIRHDTRMRYMDKPLRSADAVSVVLLISLASPIVLGVGGKPKNLRAIIFMLCAFVPSVLAHVRMLRDSTNLAFLSAPYLFFLCSYGQFVSSLTLSLC